MTRTVALLGSTRLTRVVLPYLLERRGVRVVSVDPGDEHEADPWFAPVRGLCADNGVSIGRRAADLTLDLDPTARPIQGEGPMLRLLPPVGARSSDINRALLDGGAWEVTFGNDRGSWGRKGVEVEDEDDAEALLDRATLRAVEALDAGWEPMLAGDAPTPLDRPLVGGRFRVAETFLTWARDARSVTARVRACAGPWGGARTHVGDNAVWLLDARVVADETPEGFEPGAIVRVDGGVEVATGRGVVRIERLRPGWRPARGAGGYLREIGLSEGYVLV
jgi:hypothetical protein